MKILKNFRLISIRSRLFAAFLLMALVPAAVFSAVAASVGLSKGRQQVINQLESVTAIKESELNTWTVEVQNILISLTVEKRIANDLRSVLAPTQAPASHQEAYDRLHDYFAGVLLQTLQFEELFLVNPHRQVVFSTTLEREGKLDDPASQVYLREGLKGDYVNPPAYGLSVGKSTLVVVRPIRDEDGKPLGILAGRVSTTILSDIMLERAGLGETGETYLVMENYIPLTTLRFPNNQVSLTHRIFTKATDQAINSHINGSGVYENYQGADVIGVYHWLPKLQVGLIAEQYKTEALNVTYTTLWIYVGVALAAALLASLVAFYLGQSITSPLDQLVGLVRRMAAGDQKRMPRLQREDEIGILAKAFSDKDLQLRNLIESLDKQVLERTNALGRKAVQLETIAQISRGITSILDIDDLLQRVVDLIKTSFNFYYLGIFLVEKETNRLVFRAGTGEVGKQFMEDKLSFAIGSESLNGETALNGEAIIVNDVLQDPRYLHLEQLTETRAELVIPLKVGERVIGTLDVQSCKSDAFDAETLQVMHSLGDQVAIAIENANLYSHQHTLTVIEERNRLARELHDSVTQSLYTLVLFSGAGQEQADQGALADSVRYLVRIEEVARQALKEMRLLLYELRPPMLDAEGLTGALRQRIEAVEQRSGISTQLMMEENLDLPATIEEGFYRIAQEALNNALKHSAAQSVVVRISTRNGDAMLEVIDNGTGFDYEAARNKGGMGLISMQERSESLNGHLDLQSAPGKGTCLRVVVRLADSASQ